MLEIRQLRRSRTRRETHFPSPEILTCLLSVAPHEQREMSLAIRWIIFSMYKDTSVISASRAFKRFSEGPPPRTAQRRI